MTNVSRAEVLDLLSQWESGELSEQAVHEEAEALWERYDGPRDVSEADTNSILVEALSQLEILNHQLITTEDIPAFRKFLGASTGSELTAWEVWRQYWDNIDLDQRKRALRSNPYYMT